MKKLINDPKHVTREMLEGFVAINPTLALLNDDTMVVCGDLASGGKKRASRWSREAALDTSRHMLVTWGRAC